MSVYVVPAKPSRKRAAVWREVKRLGALYLHDGVCVLPDTEVARSQLEALADRVETLGGRATLIWDACIDERTAEALQRELVGARRAEYAEVETAATGLLRHLEHESVHRTFSRQEMAGLASDLSRLERWLDQVAARDYLGDGDPAPAAAAVRGCRAALAQLATGAAQRA